MRGRRLVALTLALLTCGSGDAEGDDAPSDVTGSRPSHERAREDAPETDAYASPEVPYDASFQKSVHNAYERSEPLLDQLVYHRVRSLELDIHTRRSATSAPPGDWFVFHDDNPLTRRTSCSKLSGCLAQLAAFDAAVPRHEVVTLFVDLKTPFEEKHLPDDLDAAFVNALGRDRIVTPADLVAACPGATTLRSAVTGGCAFPTLRALRGKFLIAVTGGSSCSRSSLVSQYAAAGLLDRVGFLAPGVDGGCTVASYDARPNVVFFNMTSSEKNRALEVKRRGLVARIYGGGVAGGLDDATDFAKAKATGAVHVATNKVSFERDAWAFSHRSRGYPFSCDRCGDDLVEPAAMLAVRSTSGDLWGSTDSATFAYERDVDAATWTALVSVPSSHVEPFAKACIVARASLDPSDVNVAVCRTFDDNAPRAQLRAAFAESTRATSVPLFDGIAAESPAFLRLAVRPLPVGSEVTASASPDGWTWSTIASMKVPVPLPYRGVTVSSHGTAPVKGLFTNLTREHGGARTAMSTATLATRALGRAAKGDAFDGIFAP